MTVIWKKFIKHFKSSCQLYVVAYLLLLVNNIQCSTRQLHLCKFFSLLLLLGLVQEIIIRLIIVHRHGPIELNHDFLLFLCQFPPLSSFLSLSRPLDWWLVCPVAQLLFLLPPEAQHQQDLPLHVKTSLLMMMIGTSQEMGFWVSSSA